MPSAPTPSEGLGCLVKQLFQGAGLAYVAASIVAVSVLAGCSSSASESAAVTTSPTETATTSPTETGTTSPTETGAAGSAAEWNAKVSALIEGVGFEPPTPGAPPAPTGKSVWWIAQGLGAEAQAESAASMHSCWKLDMTRFYPVGIEINGTHLRSATHGHVLAKAHVVRKSRTLMVHQIDLYHEESGDHLCTSRVTNLIRERRDTPAAV